MCFGVCEMPLCGSPQEVHVVDQLVDLFGVTVDQPVGYFYQVIKRFPQKFLAEKRRLARDVTRTVEASSPIGSKIKPDYHNNKPNYITNHKDLEPT